MESPLLDPPRIYIKVLQYRFDPQYRFATTKPLETCRAWECCTKAPLCKPSRWGVPRGLFFPDAPGDKLCSSPGEMPHNPYAIEIQEELLISGASRDIRLFYGQGDVLLVLVSPPQVAQYPYSDQGPSRRASAVANVQDRY